MIIDLFELSYKLVIEVKQAIFTIYRLQFTVFTYLCTQVYTIIIIGN